MIRPCCLVASCILAFGIELPRASGLRAGFDDPLPPRAIARLGSYRFYHGPGASSAVLSPDGRIVASATQDAFYYAADKERNAYERTIILWDSATGRRIRELQVPHAPVYRLAFSPDGRQLAASYGKNKHKSGIALFDVEAGKLRKHFGNGSLSLVQFSADGKTLLLSEGYGGTLTTWDIETGKRLLRRQVPKGPSKWLKVREYVHRCVPSPDGKFFAWLVDEAPDYGKVKMGRELVIIPPHVARPTVLLITDAGTDKPLYRKEFDPGCLKAFAFSPGARYFMTGGDKITAYETATGKELFNLDARSTYSFALSPDGRWAVVMTGASQVRLWDLRTRKLSHELLPGLIPVWSRLDTPQVFSEDGKTVLVVTLSTLRLFDTATGKERLSLGHRSRITPRFSADGRTLFTTCDERRQSWDVSPGKKPTLESDKPRNTWEGICGQKVVAHSPDGRYFVDRNDARMRLRETANGHVVRELESSRRPIFGMFSQDATRLLVWHSSFRETFNGFGLYDPSTGKKTGEIDTKRIRVGYYPAISPDGRHVAWPDRTHDVHLHDGVTGKLLRTLRSARPLPKAQCNNADLLFSPDGKHLIVTTYLHEILAKADGDKSVTLPTRVFHVASGREISRFYSNPKTTTRALQHSCAACSPDGRFLAVAEPESGTIRLIEIAGGKVRAEFTGHRHGVHALAFAPDGKTLASGGEDSITVLWDVGGPDGSR